MTALTGDIHEAVELERRQSGGQLVRLLWVAGADQVVIEQTTFRDDGDRIALRCPPKDRALDAFRHPERFGEVKLSYRYQVTSGQMPAAQRRPTPGTNVVPASSSTYGRPSL